ncbi:tetratricopeptide repeat protein [Vibrio aquimaris]|uniref:protein O-GlcNAc transferase n=1 Tax=Vibrio aquimaris TaxID=2587862 RepID=A0A5P9CG30_9VIBR|nr:tetratricopeptide repeat protein [Vibrio aquimaris]QFT25268.1 TPR repeat-containing protein YrrB [Vibrio aquimaris]
MASETALNETIERLIEQYNQGQVNLVLKQAQALSLQHPNNSMIWNILGVASKSVGEMDQALEAFEQVIDLCPENVGGYNNLAVVLRDKGKLQEALGYYQKALALKPDYAEAHNNKGVVLRDLGNQKDAVKAYQQALTINPDYAEAHNNLGIIFQEQDKLKQAYECYMKALSLKPNHVEAYDNLGAVLEKQDKPELAVMAYQKALTLDPHMKSVRLKKLYQQARLCDWPAMEEDIPKVETLGIQGKAVSPFAALTFEDSPLRHRLRSEQFVKSKHLVCDLPQIAKPNQKPSRLRIGYFSADFHDHATMHLMSKVFALHDREKFDVYAYSFGPNTGDDIRKKAPDLFDVFHDVAKLSDLEIAKLARKDRIDIAVDLKGHTRDGRLGIFAKRPAALQISHVGYPGTTGADFIDYLIADSYLIPQEQRPYYTENIIYLPNSYQPNNNTRLIPICSSTRQELGLPDKGLVFCCFNSPYKLSPKEFDIWMNVLKKVKGSVLWLFSNNPHVQRNLKQHAEQRGVNSERLIFAKPLQQEEHLARYQHADIFLDTFNVNAHTTASDALWAGVPVVTKSGQGFAARVSTSLLHAVGLPELVTHTNEEYLQVILQLANKPEKLAEIKQTLTSQPMSKPLFDTERYTQNLEKAYIMAYQDYFDQKSYTDIWVKEQ